MFSAEFFQITLAVVQRGKRTISESPINVLRVLVHEKMGARLMGKLG